jgi:hypothetical protein
MVTNLVREDNLEKFSKYFIKIKVYKYKLM